jgi:periplasmic copper chaperone A
MSTTMRLRRTTMLIAAAALAGCSAAPTAPTIDDPWVRSNPNGLGAAYLTITSPTDDRLVAAEVDPAIATSVEIHEVVQVDGRMLMRERGSGIVLTAGQAVELRPGGLHLMLLGMPEMLEIGTTLTLTLRFATAEPITVIAEVREGADDATSEMQHLEGMHPDGGHRMTEHGTMGMADHEG